MLTIMRPFTQLIMPAMRLAAVSKLPTQIMRPAIVSNLSAFRPIATTAVLKSHGKSDRDLQIKLQEEFKFEQENNNEEPDSVIAHNKKGSFKIESKPGEKEVTLTRTFGNEKITIIASTDSLNEQPETEEEEAEENTSLPVSLTVLVEKSADGVDAGALELAVTLQDESFFIDNVVFSKSSSLAADQTAEGDWQRRGQYGGPVFQDLDEDLQDHFHNFLKDRGFDENLARVIPDYIEYKEQQEYAAWLKSVGEWVAK